MDYKTAFEEVKKLLLKEKNEYGYWTGGLSSSALSTATAISALSLTEDLENKEIIANAVKWLVSNQNIDGGWGDTIKSPSNLPTSLLVDAAFTLSGKDKEYKESLDKLSAYLDRTSGKTTAERIAALYKIYGKDKTFVVPILMNLALAGKVDWKDVPVLPFEIAALPFSFYRIIKLPVVSYALPALIAIGQLVHDKRNSKNILRNITMNRTHLKLALIQPDSGGYLEAVPLTAFVTMSIIPLYTKDDVVAVKGIKFLKESARPDGSFPIDTDLSCWLTTQAVQALSVSDKRMHKGYFDTKDWLIDIQTKKRHKYTDSPAGGWGWSDLSGSVPDADDTAGALIALKNLGVEGSFTAGRWGVRWLLDIQNKDGGFPTFCKGWMELPFDKSAADITAHAIRAFESWKEHTIYKEEMKNGIRKGFEFLKKNQAEDGSWSPLWFGSHYEAGIFNKVYGTSRVLELYGELQMTGKEEAVKGARFLIGLQNEDGGWGGTKGAPSSIEETSLAVTGLSGFINENENAKTAFFKGADYLCKRIENKELEAVPIGLYFSSLWYYEKLYPLIWSVGALGRVLNSKFETLPDS